MPLNRIPRDPQARQIIISDRTSMVGAIAVIVAIAAVVFAIIMLDYFL